MNYWAPQRAKAPVLFEKIILVGLVSAGVLTLANFFNWWFREEHIASLPLFMVLTIIFWWGITRMVISWIAYSNMKIPERKVAKRKDLRVAIFTTSSPGEPAGMFEKTLAACARVNYPHTTYLLDDTGDPLFKKIAEENGAVWMELIGYPAAKAGKINEALKRTTEDFILVLDPDHIPFPQFLDEVLGYFDDAKVGFVQVSQAYYNQYRSFTARAAAEQTYVFYGPTQIGLNGYNCSVAIGANCTFRRTALESIGGHGTGLAEDLVTAIRLHGQGWKSVYVPAILSRGLVPEDFGSFCKQQLKWSRGVHEVLFAELPRLWKRLSGWQRLSYMAIGSYYLSGLIMLLFLLIPFLFLWFGILPAYMDFIDFFVNWVPLALMELLIYLYVQRWLCAPGQERGFHWRGMLLKFACWYVFLKGFVLAVGNRQLPYIPTAKKAVSGVSAYVIPLLIHQVLFVLTIMFVVVQRIYFTHEARITLSSGEVWGMVAFAGIAFLISVGGLFAALQSRRIKPGEPWRQVPLPRTNRGTEEITISAQRKIQEAV